MNSGMFWLVAAAVIGLGIAGFAFMAIAAGTFTPSDARSPATVGGVTCLLLATGILITALLAFQKKQ